MDIHVLFMTLRGKHSVTQCLKKRNLPESVLGVEFLEQSHHPIVRECFIHPVIPTIGIWIASTLGYYGNVTMNICTQGVLMWHVFNSPVLNGYLCVELLGWMATLYELSVKLQDAFPKPVLKLRETL